jgi:hypothetical protein
MAIDPRVLSRIGEALIQGFEEDRRATLLHADADRVSDLLVLQEEHDRLANEPDVPRELIAELQATIRDLGILRAAENDLAARLGSYRDVGPDEWMIAGRIVDRSGDPVAGATIRVADAIGRFTRALGTEKTNRRGEFSRVYNLKDHAELLKAGPDVTVEVMDDRGRSRFKSTETVKAALGSTAYFDIQIGVAQNPFGLPPAPTPRRAPAAPRQAGQSSPAQGAG